MDEKQKRLSSYDQRFFSVIWWWWWCTKEQTNRCVIKCACALLASHFFPSVFFLRTSKYKSSRFSFFPFFVHTFFVVLIGRAWTICSMVYQVKVKVRFVLTNYRRHLFVLLREHWENNCSLNTSHVHRLLSYWSFSLIVNSVITYTTLVCVCLHIDTHVSMLIACLVNICIVTFVDNFVDPSSFSFLPPLRLIYVRRTKKTNYWTYQSV